MKRSTSMLLGMALILLLAAAGFYLYRNLTPYNETVEHGPAPEARANHFLAAEAFLRGRGIKVSTAGGMEALANLPSNGQTLILLGTRENLTPGQSERLLAWSAAGGHLIVTAERLWDEK